MRIAFVGGGTGGHFYPLIATAEAIRAHNQTAEMIYIGPTSYDEAELTANNIRHVYCPAGKVRRYFSVQNFFDSFKTFVGIFVAMYQLFIWYPDVIFSKGGFTSVPVLLVARFYRIPVVIHESDSKPGRASLLARNFAQYIGIAYTEVAQYFPAAKTALVGIPIRNVITTIDTDPFTKLGITKDLPLIFITGGSLGADRINGLVLKSLTRLLPNFRIFHQTGTQLEATVIQTAQALVTDPDLLSRYYVKGSITASTMAALYDAASIVISRAGSTSLFEIALHGKPSIIIPIPEEISHDQRTNAYAYARSGAASVLEEGNLTENLLTSEIQSIMGDADKYRQMSAAAKAFAKPDAATIVASALISIGIEHGS
jgi:UDP-N-acetylglucosamine--N-acetylmuramyl-(pentapeptide) pyrophosphoryl-undecaprenol N-acetylglucosamine transferase